MLFRKCYEENRSTICHSFLSVGKNLMRLILRIIFCLDFLVGVGLNFMKYYEQSDMNFIILTKSVTRLFIQEKGSKISKLVLSTFNKLH